jgi:PASTA domain
MSVIALVSLLALSVLAPTASADPLSMTFTEGRANVGADQLTDDPLFEPPKTAALEAQIDLGGSITTGYLAVPQFFTSIEDPVVADVAVDFDIEVISGDFNLATGALTLQTTTGGTLTANGKECAVSTSPSVLTYSTLTAASAEGSPRSGAPFTHGLTGAGAIAGQWNDLTATPVNPPEGEAVCEVAEEAMEGPGGFWFEQKGDVVPPSAPQLTSTNPASPNPSGTPRIRGTAESGSTLRVYAGQNCAGAPVATSSAAELGSPGIRVEVGEGVTAAFSATATDAAGNTSACSTSISYTRPRHGDPPAPGCIVPKLVGKKLKVAKKKIRAAGCKVGTVQKPSQPKGKGRRALVVKSSSPAAGKRSASGNVDITLGPKPRKAHR